MCSFARVSRDEILRSVSWGRLAYFSASYAYLVLDPYSDPCFLLPLDVWCIVSVCGHEFQYMISILALVYGLRNILLFLLTCTMLSYELVCSWRSYSFVNVGQLLRPDCISHPCPMIRARMRSRLCRGWKNIASMCDLLLIRRVHSVAGLITSAFEHIAPTFDSYRLGV